MRVVKEPPEFPGIAKRSNASSGSRFWHSTYCGALKIKDESRTKNDSTLKKLLLVFIFSSAEQYGKQQS